MMDYNAILVERLTDEATLESPRIREERRILRRAAQAALVEAEAAYLSKTYGAADQSTFQNLAGRLMELERLLLIQEREREEASVELEQAAELNQSLDIADLKEVYQSRAREAKEKVAALDEAIAKLRADCRDTRMALQALESRGKTDRESWMEEAQRHPAVRNTRMIQNRIRVLLMRMIDREEFQRAFSIARAEQLPTEMLEELIDAKAAKKLSIDRARSLFRKLKNHKELRPAGTTNLILMRDIVAATDARGRPLVLIAVSPNGDEERIPPLADKLFELNARNVISVAA